MKATTLLVGMSAGAMAMAAGFWVGTRPAPIAHGAPAEPERREPTEVHEVDHFACGPDRTCVVMSDGSTHVIRIDSEGRGWIEEDPERERERIAPRAATP